MLTNYLQFTETTNATGLASNFGATNGSTTTDLSQYYDPSAYWQATAAGGYTSTGSTAAWPGYDQTSGQTDYAAYYQQQAVAHAQNAIAQQQLQSTAQQYSNENDDMALIGRYCVFSNDFFGNIC